ncbi:hypothetical protein OSB04_008083 [Centaurea solstitialis]|uniref:Copia protein n=1 Tax=Centaurea solstitialis TaxID=347529 RepID=A0AA38TTM0_9ASTR|nr:hypothetical protein OSB04_008083 [Centaurea solstitialis]
MESSIGRKVGLWCEIRSKSCVFGASGKPRDLAPRPEVTRTGTFRKENDEVEAPEFASSVSMEKVGKDGVTYYLSSFKHKFWTSFRFQTNVGYFLDKLVFLENGCYRTAVDVTTYRGMIGSLMYLTASRPGIMFSTCLCARYQSKPKVSHLKAVKRIFRYLKGTVNLGIWYPKGSGYELTGYTDADHGGCKLDRKSTTGHIQFLGDKLVSWASKKQNCVSLSTAEAEYVAAASCCSQIIWMRTQLRDYGFKFDKIPIYCDSKSAIAISCNPVQHTKTKHIDIRYHFIKDHVEKGTTELYFVNTEFQLADLFTKALDEKRFNFLITKLGESINKYIKKRSFKFWYKVTYFTGSEVLKLLWTASAGSPTQEVILERNEG